MTDVFVEQPLASPGSAKYIKLALSLEWTLVEQHKRNVSEGKFYNFYKRNLSLLESVSV